MEILVSNHCAIHLPSPRPLCVISRCVSSPPPLLASSPTASASACADLHLASRSGARRRCRHRPAASAASRIMSDMKDTNAAGPETVGNPDPMDQTEDNSMPSAQEQELAIKKKFGGLMPKKPPLISKDHERAYFDSADWALGKSGQQGTAKPKGPLEALRPKLQPTRQQQQRSRRLINTSSENEDGDGAGAEDMNIN
uniref:Negatively light-regulated protein n=1 Tax=Oryza punctata TaxID=4537 RepID=A0A0E0JGD7_ORYPU